MTAFATCWFKGSFSDGIAQTCTEGTELQDLDLGRNARFALFSAAYTGCAQHFIYNVLYTHLFSSSRSAINVAKKVLTDSFVHAPFLYLPVYYASQSLMKSDLPGTPMEKCLFGLRKYRDEAQETLTKYWLVWTPVQVINFKFMPTELRVAFMASVSFGWLIALSVISHRDEIKSHSTNTAA